MTALILKAAPLVELAAPKLQALYRRFLHGLDTFAEARMRKAVPQHQLRQARREIDRYHRLMHASRKLPAKPARAGR
jgi:hypothetical protein